MISCLISPETRLTSSCVPPASRIGLVTCPAPISCPITLTTSPMALHPSRAVLISLTNSPITETSTRRFLIVSSMAVGFSCKNSRICLAVVATALAATCTPFFNWSANALAICGFPSKNPLKASASVLMLANKSFCCPKGSRIPVAEAIRASRAGLMASKRST